MVDWKKDYKASDLLKRDKASKEAAAESEAAVDGDEDHAAEQPQSLLKKEIHLFGRRPKAARAPKEPKAAKTPKAPKEPKPDSDVPWYRKEVSLKSKAPDPADPSEPSVPWYKKEVSLKKGKAPAETREAGETVERSVPWYKKEVSLRRKPEPEARPESPPLPLVSQRPDPPVELPPAEPEPLAEPEPVEERTPPPVVQAVPDPDPEPEAEIVPLVPRAAVAPDPEPDPEPDPLPEPVAPPAALAPEPLPEPEPLAEPVRAVSWVDAVLENRPPLPEPEPAPVPAPVEPIAELPVEPVPVEPVAQPVDEAALEPDPKQVAADEPEPRPIHPPVTADELPPLRDEAPALPWYKRELSFGRKKTKEPFELDAPKVPFWKKDLSLGRGAAKQDAKPEPVAAEEDAAPAAKSVPFWKKELSLGRRAKKTKAPEPVAAEAAPAKEKPVPFWKRDLAFGKAKQPKAAEEPSAEQAEKTAKPASKPFWKRDLSLNVSLPQRGGGGGGGKGGAMPKQLVGLKIGSSQVAAARVANNGHAEVLQVAREALDQGVVVGGELRDPEALAEALSDFFRRHKLPKRGVRLGVANNRIGVRTFEIGGIDDPKQLANAIRFRAQEALPIPIEEAVLDYQVLDESVNEDGEKVRRIMLVVAYRELVDRYVDACRKAGIALVGIDLEAFALLRALAAPPEGDAGNAALVAVAVGHDRSTFAVSDGRVCEFTRVLDWGGLNLNVAIARALDVTPSEAEPFKHVLSLDGGPAPEGVSEEQLAAAREAASAQVNNFARELVSSLQFYQSQPGSLGIGEIILTGGTAHLQGFAAQLQRLIGVKVRIGDPLVRVKVPKRFEEPEQIGSLAVAIGLGIED